MIDYEPQNLRYTDDVIATLQSGWNALDICSALNISIRDAAYHIRETRGMTHKGTPIMPRKNAPLSLYPTDPAWYAARTAKEASAELRVCMTKAYELAKNAGAKYRIFRKYPTDPKWYASRTVAQIAKELGMKQNTVRAYISQYQYPYKRVNIPRFQWPCDPEWYASRTVWDVAKELQKSPETVKLAVRRLNVKLKPGYE